MPCWLQMSVIFARNVKFFQNKKRPFYVSEVEIGKTTHGRAAITLWIKSIISFDQKGIAYVQQASVTVSVQWPAVVTECPAVLAKLYS